MLAYSQLRNVLPGLPVQPLTGQNVFYRAITLEALYGFHQNPPYTSIRPLYNLGAPAGGARFTPQNGPPALYLTAEPETAFAEVEQFYAKLRQQNPPLFALTRPVVLISVNVHLEQVLDVTDAAIQAALQTTPQELAGSWRVPQNQGLLAPTQELGQAAFDCGAIQALRYESVQHPGHACYVIFTDRLQNTASFVEVHDPDNNLRERLP